MKNTQSFLFVVYFNTGTPSQQKFNVSARDRAGAIAHAKSLAVGAIQSISAVKYG